MTTDQSKQNEKPTFSYNGNKSCGDLFYPKNINLFFEET